MTENEAVPLYYEAEFL